MIWLTATYSILLLVAQRITGLQSPSVDTWFGQELGQVQYCERLTLINVAIMRILECIYECILAVSTSTFLYLLEHFCIFEYFSCVLCKDDKLSSIQCFCVYTMPEKYNLVFLISSNKDLWQQMYLPHPTQKGIDFTFHILEEGWWQNGPSC